MTLPPTDARLAVFVAWLGGSPTQPQYVNKWFFPQKEKRASPRTIVERNANSTSPTMLEQFDRMFLPKFSKSWDLHLNQTLGFSFAQILFVENLYNRFWWFFLEAGSIFPVESNCARSPGGNTSSGGSFGKSWGRLGKIPKWHQVWDFPVHHVEPHILGVNNLKQPFWNASWVKHPPK